MCEVSYGDLRLKLDLRAAFINSDGPEQRRLSWCPCYCYSCYTEWKPLKKGIQATLPRIDNMTLFEGAKRGWVSTLIFERYLQTRPEV